MIKNKKITIKQLYQRYNYPCWDISLLEKNIVPLPYIPKDKVICDHKYSLTYTEWKKIVITLFANMMLLLETGLKIKLPHRIGLLQLKKIRGTSIDKIHLAKTGEIKKVRHVHTNGYKPILKWSRFNQDANFANKSLWKINFLKPRWRKLIRDIEKDFSKINKLIDV